MRRWAAHPDVLLKSESMLQFGRCCGYRRPVAQTGRLHPCFVGGYDDGKRLDALRLPVMAHRCGRLGAGRPQCLSEDVESRRQTLARRSIAERQKNRTGFESSFNQVLDVAQKSAAQRAQIAAATPRIRPDRRVRAAWHISFFSPKNSIRNSQAGLLTQHPRPAQSSRLSPMTSCARLRFTAAVLSEIRTPFPFHPSNSYGHL